MSNTPAYPGRVAADSDLKVADNNTVTTLAAACSATDTVLFVAAAGAFGPNVLATIEGEIVAIASTSTSGTQMLQVAPGGRGFDSTAAKAHPAGAQVEMLITAWHHNQLSAEVQAIEATLGPNLSGVPISTLVNAKSHQFAPITPGGTLNVGSNSITLSPMPAGLAVGGRLYISGGTGTAESVPITGVSSTAVIVTCASAHSGAWTIQSATLGIGEGIGALPASGGTVDARSITGAQTLIGTCVIPQNVTVLLGPVTLTGPSNAPAFQLVGSYAGLIGESPETTIIISPAASGQGIQAANQNTALYLQNITIRNLSVRMTAAGSADGIDLYATWYSRVENVYVTGLGASVSTGTGIMLTDATSVGTAQGAYVNTFRHCIVSDNTQKGFARGIWLNATSSTWAITIVHMDQCYSQWNGQALVIGGVASCHWVNIQSGGYNYSTSNGINCQYSDGLYITGSDVEGNGGWGLTGTTATEIAVYASFANNTSGAVNPALVVTRMWDGSDHGGTNRGQINFFGDHPTLVLRNNNFTYGNRVGVDIDGATLGLAFNLTSTSATQGNLTDTTQPGTIVRISGAGMTLLTATAGANPRTLTQQLFVNTAGNVQFGAGTTGAGTPLLGANCPATVMAAPYTWIQSKAPDGTTVFLPAWK